MRISLFVYGSWGDLRPFVVLGKGLQAAGYDVQIIAARIYEDWIRARGLDYYPLTVDMNQLIADLGSRDVFNPLEQLRMVRKELPQALTQMGLDVLEATRDSDVLVTIEFGVSVLMGVIDVNHLKTLVVNPAPITPTGEFASTMPKKPRWLLSEARYNRLGYTIFRRIQWTLLSSPRKRLQTHLGLPQNTFEKFQAILDAAPTLTVVSRHVVQRPADWKAHQQITGYLFDDDAEWTPPQDLVDFLAAGEKPIYIGFGSMPDSKPQATTRTLMNAVRQAGKRAVILTGWAKLGTGDVPENIHILKYAPHNWLFPQMAAVVHHGGAGTTASGFRAGVPSIIVPHSGDQPYWGRRAFELGVGTQPIPRGKLTAEKLASAIVEATTNRAMQESAKNLGEKISFEDGVGEAVRAIQEFLK